MPSCAAWSVGLGKTHVIQPGVVNVPIGLTISVPCQLYQAVLMSHFHLPHYKGHLVLETNNSIKLVLTVVPLNSMASFKHRTESSLEAPETFCLAITAWQLRGKLEYDSDQKFPSRMLAKDKGLIFRITSCRPKMQVHTELGPREAFRHIQDTSSLIGLPIRCPVSLTSCEISRDTF